MLPLGQIQRSLRLQAEEVSLRTREEMEHALSADLDRAKIALDKTRRAYAQALREFNDFIMRGAIPARFKEPEQRCLSKLIVRRRLPVRSSP